MNKLLATALMVGLAATSAQAGSAYWDKKVSVKDRIEGTVEGYKVPGYYKWLNKRKGGIENASPWQAKKLNEVLKRMDDEQTMRDNVCFHLDDRAQDLYNVSDPAAIEQYENIVFIHDVVLECEGG